MYGIFDRTIAKYTVMYGGVYIQFWPILTMTKKHIQ